MNTKILKRLFLVALACSVTSFASEMMLRYRYAGYQGYSTYKANLMEVYSINFMKEQPDEEGEKGNRTDFRDVRLLLVEDNPINQEIAVMLLSHEGFLVDCAEDGQAAVDAIVQAEPGTYDAVLMDIQMPVMDGYQATRTIRALDDPARAGVPIVAMTADAFQEDQKKAYDAGMQGHIAKPIDMKQMLDTLKSVLGR